jgi:thioredoxin-like negative regulator of GroEL
VRLLKLNSDQYPEAAQALGVQGIPALFLIEDGRIVARHAGLMSTQQLIAFARQAQAVQTAEGAR